MVSPTIGCNCHVIERGKLFSYDSKPAIETDFGIKPEDYVRSFYQCKNCDHWFAEHDIHLDDLYNHQYFNDTYGSYEKVKEKFDAINKLPLKSSDNKNRVRRVTDYCSAYLDARGLDKTLLDIGGGVGVFAYQMQKVGWVSTMVETDKDAVEYHRNILGMESFLPEDLFAHKQACSFSLLSFNKVLEHLEDPIKMLQTYSKALSPGGLAYFEVPSWEAAEKGPDREEFCLEHFHVFSLKSAKTLMVSSGFETLFLENIIEPSGKFTIYGFARKA